MKEQPKIVEGNVTFSREADYSQVEEITGYLYCRDTDKDSFPKLTTIGGYLYCRDTDKVCFPKLTTIGGYLYCRDTDKVCFPKLTTIGGHFYCRDTDKDSFPKLRKKNIGPEIAWRKVMAAFKRKGFVLFDDILAVILSTKERTNGAKVHRIRIIGKLKVSFCIEMDGTFSHGDTIKQARESFLYKVSNRDKSTYEGWDISRKITKREAIESYRVITGACESGVRQFVEGIGKLKSRYTVREIIELTKGQFGHDEYSAFFSK